ncbi:MAG: orotidine-5'-phosphate decarboxylase [Candidatus Omnitrophica bacterium]|nr:orotidine-5'-phosphate decarboxylase [Candidatus Omnitrophota bacterium]
MNLAWGKLIVALDLKSQDEIKKVIEVLAPQVKKFKIGLVAYTKFGPEIIKWVKEQGGEIFLDFKLYDIPNTMAETAKNFVDLDVWAFTVHLKSGREALEILKKKISDYAKEKSKKAPLLIGVTELTSTNASIEKVLELARIGKQSDVDGVVCSVWEAKQIKEALGLLTITPGIRPKQTSDDQKRAATVKSALENKADYFVVGRPIVLENDYLKAAQIVLES